MPKQVEKQATPSQIREARRIVDLNVHEVSVVDRPAIRREFLVVKRLNENTEKRSEVSSMDMTEIEQAIHKMYTEHGLTLTEKALPPVLKDNAGTISTWLKTMADKADSEDAKMKLAQAAVMLADFAAGKVPEKAAEDKVFPPKPGAGGGGGGAPGGAMPPKPEEEEEMRANAKKQKALMLDDDVSTIVKVDQSGNVHVMAKGAKQLTNSRMGALAEAAKQVLGLIKEADEEAFKSLVASIAAQKEMPELTNSPGSGVRPTGEGSVDKPQQMKKFDQLEQELIATKKRLETIEKARSPSTSVDGTGSTETKTPIKKSVWSGLL